MGPDERASRELHSTWVDAVNAAICPLLTLMADDVRVLNPAERRSAGMSFPPSSRRPPTVLGSMHQQLEDVVVVAKFALHAEPGLVIGDPRAGREAMSSPVIVSRYTANNPMALAPGRDAALLPPATPFTRIAPSERPERK